MFVLSVLFHGHFLLTFSGYSVIYWKYPCTTMLRVWPKWTVKATQDFYKCCFFQSPRMAKRGIWSVEESSHNLEVFKEKRIICIQQLINKRNVRVRNPSKTDIKRQSNVSILQKPKSYCTSLDTVSMKVSWYWTETLHCYAGTSLLWVKKAKQKYNHYL